MRLHLPALGRRPVPPEVRDLPLPAGERRTAWALTTAGEPVVATDQALHLPGGQRLAWPDVERARWQRPRLQVREVAPVAGAGRLHVLELTGEDELAEVVHARVTASVAWSSHYRLSPGGGVRVVGRRRPGLDPLDWQLVYDEGTAVADPLVRAQAEQLLDSARRSIG